MTYALIAMAGCYVGTVIVFAGVLRAVIRQQHRERDLLVNQVCSLAGKPWQEAPATVRPKVEKTSTRHLLAVPERHPD